MVSETEESCSRYTSLFCSKNKAALLPFLMAAHWLWNAPNSAGTSHRVRAATAPASMNSSFGLNIRSVNVAPSPQPPKRGPQPRDAAPRSASLEALHHLRQQHEALRRSHSHLQVNYSQLQTSYVRRLWPRADQALMACRVMCVLVSTLREVVCTAT